MRPPRQLAVISIMTAALLLAAVACAPKTSTTNTAIPSSTNQPAETAVTPRPSATSPNQPASQLTPGVTPRPTVTLATAPTPTFPASPTVTPIPRTTSITWPPTPTPLPSAPSCGPGPVLTNPPMDIETITYISPLGALNPPGHTFPTTHMYFMLPSVDEGGTAGPFGDGRIFHRNLSTQPRMVLSRNWRLRT